MSHIIDREALLRRFMGNHETARQILDCFRDRAPALVEELHSLVAVTDQAAMVANVQNIFNLAASSSAIAVEQSALQLKLSATIGNMAAAREIMPVLEQQVLEAITAINSDSPHHGHQARA